MKEANKLKALIGTFLLAGGIALAFGLAVPNDDGDKIANLAAVAGLALLLVGGLIGRRRRK